MMNKGEVAKYRIADRMREAEQARVANEVWATRPRGIPRTVKAAAMLARALRPVKQFTESVRTVRHVAGHRVA
jgi:hypothetical protein